MYTKEGLNDLKTVSQDELARCFRLAYDALWAEGKFNSFTLLTELNKLLFCKIWDERKPRAKGEWYDFQTRSVPVPKNASIEQGLFVRIQQLYAQGKRQYPGVFDSNIQLSPASIRVVVGCLESVSLTNTHPDSTGKAYETLISKSFRGNFGQYFTPNPIVKFIISALPVGKHSRVLDVACGSGGFLLGALQKTNHLYGIELHKQVAHLAKVNMVLHSGNLANIIMADGLLSEEALRQKSGNEQFQFGSFDFVVTNPPFGNKVKHPASSYPHLTGLSHQAGKPRASQRTEVLFIEQCARFLKTGGILAIVVPDSILTNTSLQYVRDYIEEYYRIVAVVSLPFTAFKHTGAGVKSSVMVLQKRDKETVKEYQNLKTRLQRKIKDSHKYDTLVKNLEQEKKEIIKAYQGFKLPDKITDKKLIEKTSAFKEWRKTINARYNQELDKLKETINDEYQQQKKLVLSDYSIFMAIAEQIGYDAQGKPTGTNELDLIGSELHRFISEENLINEEI